MEDYQIFMAQQREHLLKLMDNEYLPGQQYQQELEELERVCELWSYHFSDMPLPPCSAQERTFWFALMQLEELLTSYGYALRSEWETILQRAVEDVRERLRAQQPLQDGYFACRPNGN